MPGLKGALKAGLLWLGLVAFQRPDTPKQAGRSLEGLVHYDVVRRRQEAIIEPERLGDHGAGRHKGHRS